VPVNFQEVRKHVMEFGEKALLREKELLAKKEQASAYLNANADNATALQEKVQQALQYDRALRCAIPHEAPLTLRHAPPLKQPSVTLIAADGSQINFDRHAEVQYALINYGAIITHSDLSDAPKTTNQSELFIGDQLYTSSGIISDNELAFARDLGERAFIASLSENCTPPIISLTDGPLELWRTRETDSGDSSEQEKHLAKYQNILKQLESRRVMVAGYVDRPIFNLVIRLLELSLASQAELSNLRNFQPFRGVTDFDLFGTILQPQERSAVFYIQSLSSKYYKDELRIGFFYLNIGQPDYPYLARVEIPAWVAEDLEALDDLHVTLLDQCNILEGHPYPYLLHRAHEIAKVSIQEKEQVDRMVAMELRRRGLIVKGLSHKQFQKNSLGRTRIR